MGILRRIVSMGEQAAPRGRIRRLRLRMSVDVLITLALALLALTSTAAYQLLVHRRPRRLISWL
jgi:hypothetical protein